MLMLREKRFEISCRSYVGSAYRMRSLAVSHSWIFNILLYEHFKMLLELVSLLVDFMWPGKLDVDVENAP